jgi:hypothetical protein
MNFNDNKDSATTIDALQVENLHDKYQFLSEEAARRIMVAHRITTPLLFGLRERGQGFSSNADEMRVGFEIFQSMVVAPFQQQIIDAIEDIFYYNGVTEAQLYFDPLMPLGFIADMQEQIGDNAVNRNIVESQEGEQQDESARQISELPDLDDNDDNPVGDDNQGRVIDGYTSPSDYGNRPFAMTAETKLEYEVIK